MFERGKIRRGAMVVFIFETRTTNRSPTPHIGWSDDWSTSGLTWLQIEMQKVMNVALNYYLAAIYILFLYHI